MCIILVASGQFLSKKQIQSDAGMVSLQAGECYVPDISGISYEEAEEALNKLDLNVVINGMNYSETIEKNKILSQVPGDGEKFMAKETVYVVMSGGNQEVMMPELSGMSYEDKSEMISLQGLILSDTDVSWEYSDVVEKDRVIAQDIKANTRIAVNTAVGITVSKGSISSETEVLTVPDLTGLTKEEAMERLGQLKEQEGFTYTLGEITTENSLEVEKDRIISQGLPAGSQARTDQVISLVISAGPEVVTVPNVVFAVQKDAEKMMEDAGLKVQIKKEYSTQVAAGCVISQSVNEGETVDKGSTVTLTVSLGKAPAKEDNKGNSGNSNDNGNQEPSGQPQEDNGSNGGGEQPPADNGGGYVPPAQDTPPADNAGNDPGKTIEIDPGKTIEIDPGKSIVIE